MADPDFARCAAAGAGALQRWYDQSTGQWTSTGWWNAANALTAMIRYSALTGDHAHDGCCDGDQAQFKGIFVRYLHDFWRQSRQPAYRRFILASARSVWDNNTTANYQFGLRWTGPFDRADAARQSSALDVLIAAAALAG